MCRSQRTFVLRGPCQQLNALTAGIESAGALTNLDNAE